MTFCRIWNAIRPNSSSLPNLMQFGASLALNVLGTLMIITQTNDPQKKVCLDEQGYVNISTMLKFYNGLSTLAVMLKASNDFEEAEGKSVYKNSTKISAGLAVVSNTLTWATGGKVRLGAGLANCLFNYTTGALSVAHKGAAVRPAQAQAGEGQYVAMDVQQQPPGYAPRPGQSQ